MFLNWQQGMAFQSFAVMGNYCCLNSEADAIRINGKFISQIKLRIVIYSHDYEDLQQYFKQNEEYLYNFEAM